MKATKSMMARATKDWSQIAGEAVTVRLLAGTFDAFGSELAVLRLKEKMGTGRVCYSENLGTWVYSLESQGFYEEETA